MLSMSLVNCLFVLMSIKCCVLSVACYVFSGLLVFSSLGSVVSLSMFVPPLLVLVRFSFLGLSLGESRVGSFFLVKGLRPLVWLFVRLGWQGRVYHLWLGARGVHVPPGPAIFLFSGLIWGGKAVGEEGGGLIIYDWRPRGPCAPWSGHRYLCICYYLWLGARGSMCPLVRPSFASQ